MCELEDELRQLIAIAQQHPPQSAQRRKACDRLYQKLLHSGQLARPRAPQHISGSYPEIYDTAIQRLFSYLYQNIEKYSPERGSVLAWVNYLLRIRFPDAIKEVTAYNPGVQRFSLDDLSGELPGAEPPDAHPNTLQPSAADVVDYLKTDPERLLQNTHVKGHPRATFQFIALRYVEGHTWQEISDMLTVPIPTLSTFYQRNLKKFKPLFQAHLGC